MELFTVFDEYFSLIIILQENKHGNNVGCSISSVRKVAAKCHNGFQEHQGNISFTKTTTTTTTKTNTFETNE